MTAASCLHTRSWASTARRPTAGSGASMPYHSAGRLTFAATRHAPQHSRMCGSYTIAAATPSEGTAAVADVRAGSGSGGEGGSREGEHDKLMEELMAFLWDDLQHLFDDQGIDDSKYEPEVVFEDPITKYNGIQGYLFNIAFLRRVFSPTFTLHAVRRTGPLEITTRWTMSMTLSLARGTPLRRFWDPQLTFTGTSVMGVNPETGRFSSHVDTWDAVKQQRYFSLEAFTHMLQQVGDLRKGPQGPAAGQHKVLLKRGQYEVRDYTVPPQPKAEYGFDSGGVTSSGSSGNAGPTSSGVYAVADFTGVLSDQQAREAERALRKALLRDGLQPAGRRWLLLPGGADGQGGSTSPALCRNEVLIPLESFQMP